VIDLSRFAEGLISILIGVYVLLLANGVLPRAPSNPLKLELWRRKSRGVINIAAPIIILFGLIQLVSSLGSAPLRSQNFDPKKAEGFTMHRVQAGKPDSHGWYEAVSTEGSYSVDLPGPFVDYTFEAPNDSGNKSKNYAVGLKTVEGLRFSVLERIAAPGDPSTSVAEFADKFRDSLVTAPRFTTIDGFQSVQINAVQGTEGTYTRFVKMPDRSIVMILEYPRSQASLAAQMSEGFLQSLSLKKPQATKEMVGTHD
jgi:hypothetical protein